MPETQDPTNGAPGKETPKQQTPAPKDQPTPGVSSDVSSATTPRDALRALAQEADVERLKALNIKDPHTAFAQGARDILNHPSAPGLSVLNLKALVEPVFTSGDVFPSPDDPKSVHIEPRLEFQPIMAVLSDTMQKQLGTEIIIANGRLYSLQALAAKLQTTPDDVKTRLRGKTYLDLDRDPQLKAIIDEASFPNYGGEVKREITDPEVAALGQAVEKTSKGQTPQLDTIDLTTISRAYPDRPLTSVEQEYMKIVHEVALTRQANADGTFGPTGLSESYLYDIWLRLIARNPAYTPRLDFDAVFAALSPTLKSTTGISLQPRVQLYADTKLSPLPPNTQMSNAPADVLKLLGDYDTVKTEALIEATVGGGPIR
ncbi:MAG TPA: hypothetical protein VEW42_02445 [Candidatus Eisenbacteria bacterium]|nr:hypothetical protein [Candidatus Eisenbacteria bacterium]